MKYSSGIPEVNYDAIKGLYVDAGVTVEDYIEAGIAAGTIVLVGEDERVLVLAPEFEGELSDLLL